MSDKFIEEWEKPNRSFRWWNTNGWWVYEPRERTVRTECQTKAEYDALMPKQGDMVLVRSDDDSPWQKRRFLALVDGECWCYQIGNIRESMSWPLWKPIEVGVSTKDSPAKEETK